MPSHEFNQHIPDAETLLRLQAVIDTAIDGICVIDTKGIIETINNAGASLFGYTPEELKGKNISVLMPQPVRDEHDGYLAEHLRTGRTHIIGIGREVLGQKKSGQQFPLRLAVSRVDLPGNRIIFTGILHDLTAQKAAEAEVQSLNRNLEHLVEERTEALGQAVTQLTESNDLLQHEIKERQLVEEALRNSRAELEAALIKERELGELKSRFVSMASHEFRTPLSTILSSAQLIGRYTQEQQQPNREKHVQRIISSVDNLTGILNDFLSLSKLEEGKVVCEPIEFSIYELFDELTRELDEQRKNNQRLVYIGDEALKFVTDRRLLKNTLINLLSNAIKYSFENTTVTLEVHTKSSDLILQVKDQGIGIPKEDQNHLFTRFFRAHNAINIKGTGLGLTIIKRYVDLMHGSISYVSKENEGSVFTVQLPRLSISSK